MPLAPDLTGRALDGRYELHALLGEGSFGRVYRGRDRRLERAVAVKVIKPWWAEDSAWVERFQREAQLLARVSDPGIVQVYDIGHAEEGPYYVAELVEGESLAERLKDGPLTVAEARSVAIGLTSALASAHAQGVVHCDVKPANVLLAAEGGVKVGDFGIARLAEGTSQAPSATVAGTPRYMSPEQARGRPTTAATDVYSAGVVLYEMLAGEPPFVHGSAVELGLRHLQDEPPPLPARVPAALREVLERALQKDPAERYRDGAAMATALRAASSSAPPPRGASPRAPFGAPAAERTPGRDGAAETIAGATVVMGGRAPVEPVMADTGRRTTAETRVLAEGGGSPPPTPPGAPPRGAVPGRRRRRVAIAAVLALAAAVLAVLLLTASTAHTSVPSLSGLPRGGVEARARRTRVKPDFSTRYSQAPIGIALTQDPAAGTRVAEDSTVRVVLSAGPPPVRVPGVLGSSSSAAERTLANAGLRYALAFIAAPGSEPNTVTKQSPGAAASVPRGSTVRLSVVEAPHWRALTSFSGVNDGRSVPFRILGKRWRVRYSMEYQGTCTLLLVCLGPSAEAVNLHSGAGFDSFELGEGESETHTFNGGPGLYRVVVSAGHDSAHWAMTVEDYY